MKSLLGIMVFVAVCVGLAACGGGKGATGDAGIDSQVVYDDGADDGMVASDLEQTDEPTRDILRLDVSSEVEGGDIVEVAPGDGQDSDSTGVDSCVGPACVPCPDDGLVCTREQRDPETGECVPVLQPDFCLIDGQCWFTLQPSPQNDCLFCVPSKSIVAFSPSGGDLPCDDGDLCTTGDSCDETGKCVAGVPTDCEDDNICTLDRCDPGVGCVYTNYDSECDDHDACTYNDQCRNRQCVGTQISCSTSNFCMTASCDPALGCQIVPNTLPCTDSNVCTENDVCVDGECIGARIACDDEDPCTVDSCFDGPSGGCLHQAMAGIDCDDGNECTVNDYCTRPVGQTDPVCVGYERTCDDQIPCTLDTCDNVIGCVFTPYVPAQNPCFDLPCVIGMACVDGSCQGRPNPCSDPNPCTLDRCDEVFGCRHDATSGACDDGNACTTGETCLTGFCAPPDGSLGRTDCNDHNECTADNCLPSVGCLHTPTSGSICLHSDPCSRASACQEGVCVSTEYVNCDDHNLCTIDSCDQTGQCTYVADEGAPCSDGNACTIDACGSDGMCHSVPNIGGECDDGNACTLGEKCSSEGLCGGGTALQCNDANVCTSDRCDTKVGCLHTPVTGSCDDGNVCTAPDTCYNTKCVGKPITCNDFNLCTDNLCDTNTGCYYPPNSLDCDDGEPCTSDDMCVSGKCLGVPNFEDPSVKAGKLSLGQSGNPGQGVDVDGLELTCAPKGKCVSGIDNAFAPLAWLFNPQIVAANAAGTLALLVEAEIPTPTSGTFRVNLYWGERAAPVSCDPTVAGCNYNIPLDELQPVCEPVHALDNAKLTGSKLVAGGKDYDFPVFLVFGPRLLPLTLQWAKLQATVTLTNGHVTSGAGALGGAIKAQSILDGVAAIPLNQFPYPLSREIVLLYLNIDLKPDLDVDGDGIKESVSIGWPVTLVSAHISAQL